MKEKLKEKAMVSSLKIGDLAKKTDCTVETIRFYEQERLLPAPTRSQSNYRLYGVEFVITATWTVSS